MRVLLTLTLLTFAASLFANSVPRRDLQAEALSKIPLPGHSMAPAKLPDGEGLPIEMVSEQVDLVLRAEGNTVYLDVDVTFTMRNHGDAYTMGVAYPIGPRNTMVSFHAETEGVIHEHSLRKRAEAFPTHSRNVTAQLEVCWYEWEFTFPAHEVSMHKVKYRLAVDPKLRTGYTVSTGGPWKGRISKSVVTLAVDDDLGWGRIREFGPLAGAKHLTGRVVWNYADYDPGTEHDIYISFDRNSWSRKVATNKAGKDWSHRKTLCGLMRDAHFATGRVSRDEAQNAAYAESLIHLIAEHEIKDGNFVLERKEPYMRLKNLPCPNVPPPDAKREYVEDQRDRAYVRNANELLVWLPEVLALAPHLDDRELAGRLVRSWHDLADAATNNRLYAGEARLTLTVSMAQEAARHAVALSKLLPTE